VIAVSDSIKMVQDQIARWVPQPYLPLGTDGFGRSDNRNALRRHFEIDAESIAIGVLSSLAELGEVKPEVVSEAIQRFGIEPDRTPPFFA
jgi:pyruvate dehydrogenase E1 component